MRAWIHSWWKNTSNKQKAIQIFVLVVAIALIVSLIGGYFFNWTWTGFGPYTPPTSDYQRGATLYDWLQLAIVPAAIALGVLWLSHLLQQRDQKITQLQHDRDQLLADQRANSEREAAMKHASIEREIALDNQREAALQDYYDKMSELLLDRNLRESEEGSEVRKIARVRTLTVLHRLDKLRKRRVVHFLYESGLIDKDKRIVDLRGANLREADLHRADMSGADMSGVVLSDADLHGAIMLGINLAKANLSDVNLSGADLGRANLQETNLWQANLREAELSGANLSRAMLRRSDLTEAFLIGTKLIQADLYFANLSRANLSKADLSWAMVDTEQLDKTNLEGAIMPNGKTYP